MQKRCTSRLKGLTGCPCFAGPPSWSYIPQPFDAPAGAGCTPCALGWHEAFGREVLQDITSVLLALAWHNYFLH